MIEEAYCSQEVAKLLKEKGFHIPVLSHYTKVGSVWHCEDREDFNKEAEIECYSRPTHQLTMRWLREVHKKIILIDFYRDVKYSYCILLQGECGYNYVLHYSPRLENYATYEEAVEAALKYCLTNLI
jgi:hypothetical protein